MMTNHAKEFYLLFKEKIFGPFSLPELRQMLQERRIDASARISRDKCSWRSLENPDVPAMVCSVYPVESESLPREALCAFPANRFSPYRVWGTVLQGLWNAPMAAEKLRRLPRAAFWEHAFCGALVFSFLLLGGAAASTAFFEGGIPLRMLFVLTGQFLFSAILFGELFLLQKKDDRKTNRPAGEFFTLYSAEISTVSTVLLLGWSLWKLIGMTGNAWSCYGACAYLCAALFLGLFGVVNAACGMRRILIHSFPVKPTAALFLSTFSLSQGALLFLSCRI